MLVACVRLCAGSQGCNPCTGMVDAEELLPIDNTTKRELKSTEVSTVREHKSRSFERSDDDFVPYAGGMGRGFKQFNMNCIDCGMDFQCKGIVKVSSAKKRVRRFSTRQHVFFLLCFCTDCLLDALQV